MKIAYFSPLSPQKSGIADYSERELLPFLSKYMEIDLYIDEGIIPDNPDIIKNFKIFHYKEFDKRVEDYDAIIYHIGNNPLHAYIYETLLKYPGVVVFHDVFLHGLIASMTLSKGKKKEYIDEFEYNYGKNGRDIAAKTIKFGISPDFEYPLIKKIVDFSTGVIVHSQYARGIVMKERPGAKVRKINMPISPGIKNDNPEAIRKKYNIGDNIILSSFGYLAYHKRLNVVIRTFNEFHRLHPDSKIMLIGKPLSNYDEFDKISNDLKKFVINTGFVPADDLNDYLAIPDIFINLRYPTAGETSISVLKAMEAGKPVIVSNVGWFSELPDNCCAKVNVNNYEEEILLEYLKELASNEKLRKKMGDNAREYVLKEHNPEKIAQEYYNFICDAATGDKAFAIKEISDDMADIGISENDTQVIKEIAIVLKELGIS
ncbi:MAG TPA: glycosyltransferase family 4 protein [Candidatus Methanoperedens sp.]